MLLELTSVMLHYCGAFTIFYYYYCGAGQAVSPALINRSIHGGEEVQRLCHPHTPKAVTYHEPTVM